MECVKLIHSLVYPLDIQTLHLTSWYAIYLKRVELLEIVMYERYV